MPGFLAPLLAGAARVAGPAVMRAAGPALARGVGATGGFRGVSAMQFGAVALANSDQTHLNQDKEPRNG
jgi:hypothetical protein